MSADSIYQQLRGQLAYLRLASAAEALPGELDHAVKHKLGPSEFLARLLPRNDEERVLVREVASHVYGMGELARASEIAVS